MTAAKAPFLALAVVLAAWAACRQPALPAQPEAAHSAVPTHSHALNTYYLSAAGLPALELLPAAPPAASSRVPQAPAPAAPRLRLTLPLASLPAYMPIVSAKKQGLVHQLVRTSTFLSNWALLDEAVQALGCAHAAESARALFAAPGQLLEAASALLPGGSSEAQSAFEAAVAGLSCARLGRQCLARAAPASTLLLLPGRRHAAVADIMAVERAGPGEVALTLALVASPLMVSELDEHPHQSLAADPHYHFHTPAGVEVDAAAFMDALHEVQLAPPELHLFVKGAADCWLDPTPAQIPDPYNGNLWDFEAPRCQAYFANELCQAFCKAGYVGYPTPTVARCTGDWAGGVTNTWQYVSGSCVPSCAGNPTAPLNANAFNCPAGTPINATCATTCSPGYTRTSGSLTSTCGNFTWGPVTAVCSPSPCTGNPPSTPNNGAWPAGGCNGGSTASGGSCTATCGAGFQGSPTATCSLGQWGAVSGSCSSTGCSGNPPSTPANGAWPVGGCNGGSTASGGSCTATCASGYTGNPTAQCTAAVWGAVSGSCTPNPCLGNPSSTPPHAAWPASCNGGTTPSGGSCTGACETGYSGNVVALCNAGTWGLPFGSNSCAADPCTGVPSVPVPNAAWPASCAGTASGATCTAGCNAGWAGSPTVSCSTGSWGTTISGVACVNCTVSLASDEEINICEAIDNHLDADFLYTGPYTASTMFSAVVVGVPQAECYAEPLEGPASGKLITVHCVRSGSDDDLMWPKGQYSVVLTATYTGASPCGGGSVTATALVTVSGLQLSAVKDVVPVCSNSSTVASQVTAQFAYSVTAAGTLTYSYNATTAPTPSICTIVQQASSPTAGKFIVTCVGVFPTPSSVDVALQLVVRRVGATTGCVEFEGSDVVSVEYICCKPGAAWAAAPDASSSQCFHTVDPLDVNCRRRPLKTAWGFYNRGPTPTGPAIMRAGVSARCASASTSDDYGSVIATCSDSDREIRFNLTTGLFSETTITAWYSCDPPLQLNTAAPTRTCNRFQFTFPAVLGPVNSNKPALAEDERYKYYSWVKNLDQPAFARCGCRKLNWAVYQTGMFKGLSVC